MWWSLVSYCPTDGDYSQDRGEKKKKEKKEEEMRGDGIHTVDPADGYRLEDGEEQQAGSTTGEMVIYLEHIQTTLHRGGDKHTHTTERKVYNSIS